MNAYDVFGIYFDTRNRDRTAIMEAIERAFEEATKTERDRCARVVERGLGQTNTTIARAIRNGDAP